MNDPINSTRFYSYFGLAYEFYYASFVMEKNG